MKLSEFTGMLLVLVIFIICMMAFVMHRDNENTQRTFAERGYTQRETVGSYRTMWVLPDEPCNRCGCTHYVRRGE